MKIEELKNKLIKRIETINNIKVLSFLDNVLNNFEQRWGI